MAESKVSLSWNNHRATFCHILATLREKERYTDVTVACEGKFYPVHKLVLSTCSEYFEKIFENTPCKHPVIVLKDVNRSDLEALFCYMYEGAVSVAQSNLGRLIKAAEVLRIKGLAVPDEPPISDSGGRHSSSHHHSTDDRSSPHPKRRRREGNNSHTHQRTRSSPTPPSSPRPSPLESGDSHPALRSRSDSQWDQASNDRDDGVVGHGGRLGEQLVASHAVPTPPQVEMMMDKTLVKEEMIDQEDTGQDDFLDSGIDYTSVGSDSRLDGSATGGRGDEDHLLPGKYEPKTNPSQQAIPEAVVEALAGPSGMQTVMMDETLIKEEMIDQGDTGQDDLLDSGMDYASVGSDSRLDGSATGGGGDEDHLLPGKYEPKTNPWQQAIPKAVVEALTGPSGMQMVRMPKVVSSSDEDYTPPTDDVSTVKKRGVKAGTKRGKYFKTYPKGSDVIIKAVKNSQDWKAVAEANGIPIQTAYGWIRRSGAQRKKSSGHRFSKIREEHVKKMIGYVEENQLITLREISAKLATESGINVSINTVYKRLQGQLYTVKKTLPEPAAMNTEENKQKRKAYVEKIMHRIEHGKIIIYMDETNANLFLRRPQGRPRKDLHCMPECPSSKITNVHILGSISQHGPVYWERQRGSYTKEDCQEWLRKMLRTVSLPLYNIVVVCGNVPVHSDIACIAEEEEFAGVEIVCMSPFSAPLNPIEECWSVMKASVKRDLAENFASFMDNPTDTTQTEHHMQFLECCIDNAVANLTPVLCQKTCNSVQEHFPGLIQMKDLDMADN